VTSPSAYTFVVLDLETQGLHPDRHDILEIAAVAIDLPTLEERGEPFSIVVKPRADKAMDTFVAQMHKDSGLLAEIEKDGVELAWAEQKLVAWLQAQGAKEKSVVLCGNSIQFDRKFIDHHMGPRLEEYLSHRMVDCRSLMFVAEDWLNMRFRALMTHRALPDCRVSLETMRAIRKAMCPPEMPAPAA